MKDIIIYPTPLSWIIIHSRISIHALYHGINIASVFEPIRRASIDVTLDCISVAAEIGADVVLHPGYYAWEQERCFARQQFDKSNRELSNAAEGLSLTFYFENMGDMDYFILWTSDELDLIEIPGLHLMLDMPTSIIAFQHSLNTQFIICIFMIIVGKKTSIVLLGVEISIFKK